jgi:hypothetical protein
MNFWIIPPQARYVLVAKTRECDWAVFHFSNVPEIVRNAVKPRGFFAQRLTAAQLAQTNPSRKRWSPISGDRRR